MNRVLLIDGNNIAHANHNATKLTVGDMQTQAIFGFLKSLRAMLDERSSRTFPIVLWDGRAQFRFDAYADYKGNREAGDAKQAAHKAAFKAQTPFIEKALETLAVRQLRSPNHEADDLAGHLITRAYKGMRVEMVSGDRDWIQLVRENVDWFDPIRNRRVTTENFFEFTGYQTPEAYVHGKALQGDSSDNVPGVGGIGEKGAPLFLAQWGTVDKFFEAFDAGKAGKLNKAQERLASPEGRAIFKRNLLLMDLRNPPPLQPGEAVLRPGKVNPQAFESLCKRLMFASILRDMPSFLRSFGIEREKVAA